MPYASSSDMTNRFDSREIGDLLSDTGVPVDDFSGSSKMTAALEDASGEVEAAVMVGKRYTAAELGALTGNSLGHLKRIVCDLAMRNLLARRPAYNPDLLKAFEERAKGHLDALRKGENVFNIEDHKEAGLPSVGGLTSVEFSRLNLLRDRVKHYYPARRLPDNR